MRCLCCGKNIEVTDNEKSNNNSIDGQWHVKCIRRFFGTTTMPKIDISSDYIDKIARETSDKKITVPGVQKKISLHLSKEEEYRLTLVDYHAGYILKPQTAEFTSLPEAEYFCMQMAQKSGIKVVPHGLVKPTDAEEYAYITKRIDRQISGAKKTTVKKYAMEDFCQLGSRLTKDKYRGSYEQCAKIIAKYSNRPGIDMTEFFLRIVFSFVTGNSDMHLKNFSLVEKAPGTRQFVLSDAYDLLPVNIIMPEDKEQMALTINGKKRNIRRKDFMALSDSCGINEKTARNIINGIVEKYELYVEECKESYMPENMKKQLCELMEHRVQILRG
jgi:serine/threonine-protein kinase HipA